MFVRHVDPVSEWVAPDLAALFARERELLKSYGLKDIAVRPIADTNSSELIATTVGGGEVRTTLDFDPDRVHALQLLHEQAPKRVRELLEVVGGEYGSLEAVFAEADKLVAATVQADSRALLDRFAEELGQRDRAADGAAATLAALGRGQVETLLLTGLFLDDERTAWFGPAPTDVAADRDTLAGLGVPDPVEARLVDVAVRAALGTGAGVRVLEPAAGPGQAPGEGVGALLRFPLGP